MDQLTVVLGSGPAGSICARQLALRGHDVLMTERSSSFRRRVGETCGPVVRRLLEGACGLFLPHGSYRTITSISSAWGLNQIDGRRFALWHADNGLVLDRPVFDEWLVRAAEATGVSVLRGCRISGGRKHKEGWLLDAQTEGSERTLHAGFIVEATGRGARSVVLPEVRTFATDALACVTVELPEELCDNSAALVEACREGWWYSVALPNGRHMLALFTDADLIARARGRRDWLNAVIGTTTHIRQQAPRLSGDLPIQVCGARTAVRSILWCDTWTSIGDAAWSLDPLSGAGIARAVDDGISTAAAISRALTDGDFGALRVQALTRANSFQESLAVQRRYYRAEKRWRNSAFWHRRH